MTQKRIEEKIDAMKHDLAEIRSTLQRLPAMEDTLLALAKGMEKMSLLLDKQQQWAEESSRTAADTQKLVAADTQKLVAADTQKLVAALLKGGLGTREGKGLLIGDSSVQNEESNAREETSTWRSGNDRRVEENGADSSKFRKVVEMPVFNGEDPDGWLFRADRYFNIHRLTDSEKLTVAVISFEGPALDWFRAKDGRAPFQDWAELKRQLLERFRGIREGTICGRFLAIRQEHSVDEYRNLFDKLLAPLPQLPEEVVEETFLNGLQPWIRAEVEFLEPKGLGNLTKAARRVEAREAIRREMGMGGGSPGPTQTRGLLTKKPIAGNSNLLTVDEGKKGGTLPMRTITLRGSGGEGGKREAERE